MLEVKLCGESHGIQRRSGNGYSEGLKINYHL